MSVPFLQKAAGQDPKFLGQGIDNGLGGSRVVAELHPSDSWQVPLVYALLYIANKASSCAKEQALSIIAWILTESHSIGLRRTTPHWLSIWNWASPDWHPMSWT